MNDIYSCLKDGLSFPLDEGVYASNHLGVTTLRVSTVETIGVATVGTGTSGLGMMDRAGRFEEGLKTSSSWTLSPSRLNVVFSSSSSSTCLRLRSLIMRV